MGIAHRNDIPRCAALLVDCWGAGEIELVQESFSDLELRLLGVPVGAWNELLRSFARFETELGLKVRCFDKH